MFNSRSRERKPVGSPTETLRLPTWRVPSWRAVAILTCRSPVMRSLGVGGGDLSRASPSDTGPFPV